MRHTYILNSIKLPKDEMIAMIVDFLFVKDKKINRLAAYNKEEQEYLDDVGSQISNAYKDLITFQTNFK